VKNIGYENWQKCEFGFAKIQIKVQIIRQTSETSFQPN
jgi:hypothetical protein